MKKFILTLGLLSLSGTCLALDTKMPDTAQEIGCPNCHAIDHTVVGPAWIDVSRRYRDSRNDKATFDTLVKKVSKGGEGNWGSVPMVANDPVGKRQDKIEQLVRYILSLSDQLPDSQLSKK